MSNPFESAGKQNVSCPDPPSERSWPYCKSGRRATPSTKGADRTLTAGETNRAAHISKIKSVGSDPKPVTHKTLKSVLADCRGLNGLAGGGLALTQL